MPTVTRHEHRTFLVAWLTVGAHDPRAVDTASELHVTIRRHMAAKARLRRCAVGSAEWLRTRIALDDLRRSIHELCQTLNERPWTEV